MTKFEEGMREIIPKKSIEIKLIEVYSKDTFYHEMKISSLKHNRITPTEKEEKQKNLNKEIIKLEFHQGNEKKYTEKQSIYEHPYYDDVCYFNKSLTVKIIKDLKEFDKKVGGISNEDKQRIFTSLNKMERLLNLIKKMKENKEKYKTTSRDKPIINSLIRLINSNNDKEFNDKLLDELVGYDIDCSKEIEDYHNIINYKVKSLNKKPYKEIIFNKVIFNKDVLIQYKKEYNDHYQLICDIHRNFSPRDFKNNLDYLIDSAELLGKYELH